MSKFKEGDQVVAVRMLCDESTQEPVSCKTIGTVETVHTASYGEDRRIFWIEVVDNETGESEGWFPEDMVRFNE